MAIDIPGEIAIDLRNPVAGDSFTWAGVEPAAAKKSIVIHGTASEDPNEDGFVVAAYHVNVNGWGGCGVHLVCTKDQYQGRPSESPGGVQLQYVGDLSTWRAGCIDQNPGRIHIEISGLFTGRTPSEAQLRKVRQFIEWALSPNNVLPSLNFPSQVTYHNAVPGQNTQCPGWAYPGFNEWFSYLQTGKEPSWFSTQQPALVPATPPPVIEVPAPPVANTQAFDPTATPVSTGSVLDQEYKTSYVAQSETKTTSVDGYAIDMTGAGAPIPVKSGTEIDIVGSFMDNGKKYYRSAKSIILDGAKGTWYGLSEDYFATGQVPDTIIPVNVIQKESLLISKFIALIFSPLIKLFSKGK